MGKILIALFLFPVLCFSQEYELDKNTVALWHFNENMGNTVSDESSNQVTGTLVNNPQWVDGKYGSGILLDGVNDYISFQKDGLFDFNQGSFSIEFWIKIISNDKSDNKIIFTNREDITTGHGLIIWIDTNNTLNARLRDNSGIGQPLVGPILDFNKWYNIAFVRDSASARMIFYVDGYKASEILDPTYILKSTGPFYFGRAGRAEGWETSCINAVIDEVRISNTVRVGTNTDELYDLFPIAKRNQYNYNYLYSDTTYYVGSLEYIQNDVGTISYSIIDSSNTGNQVDWLVAQKINLSRHYITYETDTSYTVQNVYNFVLTESLNGNHELTADPPIWDSTGQWGGIAIWRFPVYAPNNATIPIYRFREMPVFFLSSSIPGSGIVDSLWFNDRGMYKRTYDTEYLGNHQIYTHTQIYLGSVSVDIANHTNNIPRSFFLSQNYPNPFNPITTIEYSIPSRSNVVIKVFDLLGREVATLLNEEKQAGIYKVKFDGSGLSSGVYFYKIQTTDFIEVKKMILLK